MALKNHSGLNLESYVHTTEETNEVSEQFIQFFSSVVEFAEKHLPSWLPKGLHISEVISSAMGFVIVPLIYLSSFLANEKVPFNLNNNARWLYSAALLGLTIAAFTVPGVAPVLAITAAALSFGVAGFILVKALNKWREQRQAHAVLHKELSELKKEHEFLENETHTLQAQLEQASGNEKNNLQIALIELRTRLDTNESLLKEKEAALQLASKHNGLTKIVDKSVGLLFASVAVVGFALSIAIPPVGLAVLMATFAASLTYTLTRVVFAGIKHLRNKSAEAPKEEEEVIGKEEPSQAAFDLASKESLNHSTINMINALHATATHHNVENNVINSSKALGTSLFSHEKEVKNCEDESINSIPHQ